MSDVIVIGTTPTITYNFKVVSPSDFRACRSRGNRYWEWKQPDSTNPYMKGDKVTYNGKTYESVIDNNVWSPDTYPAGWKEFPNAGFCIGIEQINAMNGDGFLLDAGLGYINDIIVIGSRDVISLNN